MTRIEFFKKIFKQKGLNIKAVKADEELEDYVFVVEDNEGNIEVYHFYLSGPFLVPMVEIYLFDSFRRREKNKLRKRPEEFLKGFDKHMLYAAPDIEITEEEWA